MFGLTTLQHQLNPQTTLEKFVFLVDNVFTHMHKTTTLISFIALLVLVVLRNVKAAFKKYVWIYRLPEVLLVVVISTRMYKRISSNTSTDTKVLVMSDEFDWDQDGVDILGSVPINTGKNFVRFPLHHKTLRYLRRTTSTAV